MLCGFYRCVARAVNSATDVLHLRPGRADLGRRRAMADGHEFSGLCLLRCPSWWLWCSLRGRREPRVLQSVWLSRRRVDVPFPGACPGILLDSMPPSS